MLSNTIASTGTPKPEPPELEKEHRIKRFMHHDMMGTGILLLATITALVLVNVGLYDEYHHFWETQFGFAYNEAPGNISLSHTVDLSLHHWVNDGLMVIFFFVVGLEIKRELLAGELASVRRAVLPAAAALGGMVVPALLYALVNGTGRGAHGWGIPMATDIAFAAGALAAMKKWVSPSLMVFLVALAIVDDLGAVGVIALFYTDTINTGPLMIGAGCIILSFVLNTFGVRAAMPYAIIGVIIWIGFLGSGIHATVAGVFLAFSIPHTARYETLRFTDRVRELLKRFDEAEKLWPDEKPRFHEVMVNSRQQALLRHTSMEIHHVEAPLQRMEHNLEPLVVFAILPIFALANAGVHLEPGHVVEMVTEPVALGIILGLCVGKPLGIVLASWIAVKLGAASLPSGVTWPQIAGVGCLAGIGFTMSLFINELAFVAHPEIQAELVAEGKIGIFLASVISATVGILLIRLTGKRREVSTGAHGH